MQNIRSFIARLINSTVLSQKFENIKVAVVSANVNRIDARVINFVNVQLRIRKNKFYDVYISDGAS